MFRKEAVLVVLAAVSFAPRHIFAQELHLKARDAAPSSRLNRRAAMPGQDAASHWIVEFDHAPGTADLAAIAAAGAGVTGALPDNAVVVSGPSSNLAHIAGVRWAGPMETSDKLSPELDWALRSLNVVVEFHNDVTEAAQDLAAGSEGLVLTHLSVLAPGHALVSAQGNALLALAAHDEVAYIFPADPALNSDSGWMACAGMLTLTGQVGQYANIVHGWDLGADNFLHLGYIFGTLTPKVAAATVQSEIMRALNEWSKITNVIFQPADSPGASQAVYIRFASGGHGDDYPFDGPGGALAHTFYPVPINPESIAGDMHLDADENWHAGGDTDIYSVALHEAGHALGLGHSDKPGDVMYPYYRRNMPLSANDVGAVQQLYGVPSGTIPTTAAPTPTPATPLTLTPDSPPATTQAAQLTLTGTVGGGTNSITVQWQTDQAYSGRASITGNAWTAEGIGLAVGSNAITLTAFDGGGQSANKTVYVTRVQSATASPAAPVPPPPPAPGAGPIAIRISSPAGSVISTTSSTLNVSGTASAGNGVSRVTWQTAAGANGQASGTLQWAATGIPLLTGTNAIMLRAYDTAGNAAWSSLTVVKR